MNGRRLIRLHVSLLILVSLCITPGCDRTQSKNVSSAEWKKLMEEALTRDTHSGVILGILMPPDPNLHDAAFYNDLARVKELVKQGSNIEETDISGETPLYKTAFNDNAEIARFLIKSGAKVDATMSRTNLGMSVLEQAARLGHAGVVAVLLDEGADANHKSLDGWTPLHHAVLSGDQLCVKLLLAKGADLTAKGTDDRTPLTVAKLNQDEEMITLLRKSGAK